MLAPPSLPAGSNARFWGIIGLVIAFLFLVSVGRTHTFGIIMVLIFGGLGGWLLYRAYEADHDRKVQDSSHREAMARWEKAYYCEKHDIVYLPGKEETWLPEEMRSFLYR